MSNIIIQKYYLTPLSNSEFINIYLSGRNQTVVIAFLMIVLFCAIQFLLTSSTICMLILFLFAGGSAYFKTKIDTTEGANRSIHSFQYDHLRSIGSIKLRKTMDLLKQPGDKPLNKATLRRLKLILVERQKISSISLLGSGPVDIESSYLSETVQDVIENFEELYNRIVELQSASHGSSLFVAEQILNKLNFFAKTNLADLVGEYIVAIHKIVKENDNGASFFNESIWGNSNQKTIGRLVNSGDTEVRKVSFEVVSKAHEGSGFEDCVNEVQMVLEHKRNDEFFKDTAKEIIIAKEIEALISEKQVINEISKILAQE